MPSAQDSLPAAPKPPEDAFRRPGGGRLRVLVVEDEAIVALDIAATIEDFGAEVVGRAAGVREGMRAIEADRPDLVLMDVRLPDGDGIVAAREAVLRFGVRVVFVTGNRDAATLERVRAIGPMPVVAKPISTATLRSAMIAAMSPA